MQIVRGLLTTDSFTFEGEHFQVHDATLLPAARATTAPADLDRRVGREAHDADRGALRRRVALLGHAGVDDARSRQRLSAHAEAAGRDPAEITRASSLSLEDDLDTIAGNVDAWEQAGFDYLVCGWPAGGRTTVERFAERFLAHRA